jgi:hypothetical protein
MLAAFDGWVDAGSAATTALGILADDGRSWPPSTRTGCSTIEPAVRRSRSSTGG